MLKEVSLTLLTEQAKKWTAKLRWTMFFASTLLLGFVGYGIYLFIAVLGSSVDVYVAWFLLLGIALGVVGSIKLIKRTAENIKGLTRALEIIAEDVKKL